MYQNYAQNYGYTYGVQRPQARYTQPLTAEQIAKLRQNNNAFDFKVEPTDLLKGSCTHREKDGQSTLIQEADGKWRCSICGESFNMVELNHNQVKDQVEGLLDILQTIKTVYVDAPEELIINYMAIIPLLKKLSALWDRSIENFNKYENSSFGAVSPISPGYSGFNAISNMLANPYQFSYGQPVYGQQMPAPAYGQPAYGQPVAPAYGQQMPAPAYGQPAYIADPNINPMAYGVPAAAPAPGVMPTAAPAPVAAAPATAQGEEVQQQQVFNV